MRRWRRSDPYWMVTRPDTHSGVGIKALTPEEAALRALRYGCMKSAPLLAVTLFAGPAHLRGPAVQFNAAELAR